MVCGVCVCVCDSVFKPFSCKLILRNSLYNDSLATYLHAQLIIHFILEGGWVVQLIEFALIADSDDCKETFLRKNSFLFSKFDFKQVLATLAQ